MENMRFGGDAAGMRGGLASRAECTAPASVEVQTQNAKIALLAHRFAPDKDLGLSPSPGALGQVPSARMVPRTGRRAVSPPPSAIGCGRAAGGRPKRKTSRPGSCCGS